MPGFNYLLQVVYDSLHVLDGGVTMRIVILMAYAQELKAVASDALEQQIARAQLCVLDAHGEVTCEVLILDVHARLEPRHLIGRKVVGVVQARSRSACTRARLVSVEHG